MAVVNVPSVLNATEGQTLVVSGTVMVASDPSGGSTPTGTGFRHITSGTEDGAAKLVETADVSNDQITYAKMQNVSATSRVLGRKTAAAGDAEECTLSEVLDFIGSAAQGDILYRGASAWARLGAGTSGQFLKTQGAGANPIWADVPAGGEAIKVGGLYITTSSTDPATSLGYGTWSPFGAGRVLVGRDAGDADFDTAEETGGAKTVTSTGTNGNESSHTHTYTEVPNHVHVQTLPSTQAGNFACGTRDTSSGGTGGSPGTVADALSTANPTGGVASGTTAAGSAHTHTFTGDATSVVQPYIVVYMFKRTA